MLQVNLPVKNASNGELSFSLEKVVAGGGVSNSPSGASSNAPRLNPLSQGHWACLETLATLSTKLSWAG